jgi:hypothetical protein
MPIIGRPQSFPILRRRDRAIGKIGKRLPFRTTGSRNNQSGERAS